ncbi:MAG: penicillin-binding protein [Draconibacterium sp.]|nr:MAG: penicillin-binding protein [Draconibacterium sp.]
MSLRNFLTSRLFLKNLLLAIALLFFIVFLVMQWLKIYTHHGEAYPVPDFTGLTFTEATALAEKKHLKVEIADSVYANDALPGTVVEQEFDPGFKVKANRIVFLIINSVQREQVILPKLTDISFRQAQVLAENKGILIGNISYEPSEYKDLVLKVLQNSEELHPGKKIYKGSMVDLVVGVNNRGSITRLPDLTGTTLDEAHTLLTNAMLKLGVVVYDETIVSASDSLDAFIWRQEPSVKKDSMIGAGSNVDLWVTTDTFKISIEQ